MADLFPVLRVLSDQSRENARFLILGSASPDIIKNTSETLAGRVEFVDLHGFDLSETGMDGMNQLWLRGGFPLSYLGKSEEDSIAWREGFVSHPKLGASWESFVIEQILRISPALISYFWSTYSGAEVDLFTQLQGERIGIEIKFSETPKTTKSMHSAIKELDLAKLYLIYPGSERYPLHSRIEACPLPDFLSHISKLPMP